MTTSGRIPIGSGSETVHTPVLAFFNSKGGVGTTSLACHLAWMFLDLGEKVLVCDLDPQANLTSALLREEMLDELLNATPSSGADVPTISKCVEPLMSAGELREPEARMIAPGLGLIPGDLALSCFEETLSGEWPNALGSDSLYRPFRILSAFWTIMQCGAERMDASIIVADVGPNLGAINRSALIASDFVVVPLAADLLSLQGLRNLGPKLRGWRRNWHKRVEYWRQPEFPLPSGEMRPIGYVVPQRAFRLSASADLSDEWRDRIPAEYAAAVLNDVPPDVQIGPDQDPHCLASLLHYRSLVPMAQETRKPIFHLTPADGAIGGHASAVQMAKSDFKVLAKTILEKTGVWC